MNLLLSYGIGALFICFSLVTFFISRIPTDEFPDDYDFNMDPFWTIFSVMFLGATIAYFVFPQLPDMIKSYSYGTDILLPFALAFILYICHLCDWDIFSYILTFIFGLIISFLQPDDFILFPEKLTLWQDRIAVAALISFFSIGLSLLNGLGAIASMQFIVVMGCGAVLAYFSALPSLLGVLALVYFGCMLAFSFFSWPPEKLVLNNGAFMAFGFIMSCYMLNSSVEFADAPMFIAASYLVVEFFITIYNYFINNEKSDYLFMSSSYYKISEDRRYEEGVVHGVLKILLIDLVLSMLQIAASERLAIPVFALAVNWWLLSILSGESTPQPMFSITKAGFRAVKKVLSKKDNSQKLK